MLLFCILIVHRYNHLCCFVPPSFHISNNISSKQILIIVFERWLVKFTQINWNESVEKAWIIFGMSIFLTPMTNQKEKKRVNGSDACITPPSLVPLPQLEHNLLLSIYASGFVISKQQRNAHTNWCVTWVSTEQLKSSDVFFFVRPVDNNRKTDRKSCFQCSICFCIVFLWPLNHWINQNFEEKKKETR